MTLPTLPPGDSSWGNLKTQSFSLRSKSIEPHNRHLQLLKPAPEKQSPKTSSFENHLGLCGGDPQNKERFSKGSRSRNNLAQGPEQRAFQMFHVVCGRSSLVYLVYWSESRHLNTYTHIWGTMEVLSGTERGRSHLCVFSPSLPASDHLFLTKRSF